MGGTSSGAPLSSSADQALTTPDPTVAATAEEADGPVTVTQLDPEVVQQVFPRRRRLIDEQELATKHLCAETNKPVAEIARTYGYRGAVRISRGQAPWGRPQGLGQPQSSHSSEGVPSMPPSAAAPGLGSASEPGATQLEAGSQALTGRVERRFRVHYLVDRVIGAEGHPRRHQAGGGDRCDGHSGHRPR